MTDRSRPVKMLGGVALLCGAWLLAGGGPAGDARAQAPETKEVHEQIDRKSARREREHEDEAFNQSGRQHEGDSSARLRLALGEESVSHRQ